MAKVLLIDIDSKIPNLALMKLSAYHKNRGDEVELNWYFGKHDMVYASCIFKENKKLLNELPFANAIKGGSGTEDWSITLPDNVEHVMPDYDLYHCDYSMGFATRGCFRKCPFCIVRNKEGKLKPWSDIYEWWDKRHRKLLFLDNNILGSRQHFFKICEQVRKEKLRVDFNQGLDIRLMDDELAEALGSLTHEQYRFAFDNMEDEEAVRKGIKLLEKYGVKCNRFYVLCAYNTTLEQDLYRLNLLKELGQRAYLMRFKKLKAHAIMIAWPNSYSYFAAMSFDRYLQWKIKMNSKMYLDKYSEEVNRAIKGRVD